MTAPAPLGQHPAPLHVVAHVSDPQVGATPLVYGGVDGDAWLRKVMEQVIEAEPEAIVFTGDIADSGDPDAYARVHSIVDEAASSIGAAVVWVMGNHDERAAFSAGLLGQDADPLQPIDFVTWVGGLRIIALDSTIPGYHDGELTSDQLTWLAAELAEPAPDGTILAMHHPPTPTHMPLMALIELRDQHLLADVVRDTDVRAILAGHYHYSLHTTLAGIPVAVAPSTCYGIDASFDPHGISGIDDLRGFELVHVYPDLVSHATVHVPNTVTREVTGYPTASHEFVESIPEADRRDLFAKAGVLEAAIESGDVPDPASIVEP